MSTPQGPELKSQQLTLVGRPDAAPADPATGRAVVARKTPAAGRPSMPVSPDRHSPTEGPAWVIAWIHIVAPEEWSAPVSAHAWCTCGFERRATTRRGVLRVVEQHLAHRTTCLLRNPAEGRHAA
ncbi:hypothetical protein [Streptomyces sp. RKAG337]|uniref:hypothetical protein n=1 Tax=Streptomyces sp. RKAG337 TaxID=2893404 RepID=UPI0020331D6F|nr:hypothetical protein [Streptomyces sp. RKAG337]MCM2428801.1 hypothetical protein [Streptomyces sp. RKAG337]